MCKWLRCGDCALVVLVVLFIWPFGARHTERPEPVSHAPFPRNNQISCPPDPPAPTPLPLPTIPTTFVPYWKPNIRLSFDKASDLQKTGRFIGINNQREVIRAFLFMAHMLNRTVLIHDLVPHVNYPNQTLRDPNIIWDLTDLQGAVPALREPTEFAISWSFRYNVITDKTETPGSTMYWWKRQRYSVFKKEYGRYWPSLVTIEELKSVQEDVLVFEGLLWAPIDMFLFPPALEAKLEQLERNHFHFQKRIFDLALRVVRILGNYSSVHFRYGDKRAKVDFQRPMSTDLNEYLQKGENVYMSTTHVVQARRTAASWFWSDAVRLANLTAEDTQDNNLDYIACVEQVICAYGRRFFPTYESSFSEYVVWLRRWLQVPGADADFADWNARMRKPHHATSILVSPADLHRERARNMTLAQRAKSFSAWVSLEDDLHLETLSATMESCSSNVTRREIWHAWREQKLAKARNLADRPAQ